ncbi:MAG: molybdenum cofactor biosynthesis protein MoaE [Verrucomicrobia bacterium]|nr:molybdenum cofactor biosynthesis protein MoaE [Verrucomicrobiota bacterium]
MRRSLILTTAPLDEAALLHERAMSAGMGAAVYFSGVVREAEGDEKISAINYEAFQQMVERQFALIFDQLEKRWVLESVRVVHRLGVVKVGEASLWVEVVAAHRGEAFAACQFLIDEMKRTVPIWKRPVADREPSRLAARTHSANATDNPSAPSALAPLRAGTARGPGPGDTRD